MLWAILYVASLYFVPAVTVPLTLVVVLCYVGISVLHKLTITPEMKRQIITERNRRRNL